GSVLWGSMPRMPGRAAHLLVAIAGLLAAFALAACGSDLGSDSGDDQAQAEVASTTPVDGEPLTISTGPLYIDKSKGAVDGPGSTLDKFTQATGIDVEYLEDIN